MADRRICVGQFGRAHGVRGQIRLKSFTDDPFAIGDYGALTDDAGERTFELTALSPSKEVVIASVEGINDRSAAEALNGVKLYITRDQLPDDEDEDEFYYADLIGVNAYLLDGAKFGRVVAVQDFGASDLLEIELDETKDRILVPFTQAVVPVIDMANKRLSIDPPQGLLTTDDDEEDESSLSS